MKNKPAKYILDDLEKIKEAIAFLSIESITSDILEMKLTEEQKKQILIRILCAIFMFEDTLLLRIKYLGETTQLMTKIRKLEAEVEELKK